MEKYNNPWMGPGTYEEGQSYKFKGRDKDIEKIKLMLQQNDIVVCYGASGNGKSSLINAGLSPAMRNDGMFPIVITFTKDDYDNDSIDFDEVIFQRIEKSIQDYTKELREKYELRENSHVLFEVESQYRDKQIPHSLWWKLRTETIRIPYGEYNFIPVLIFDQFEEVFRVSWKDKFFKWLESLSKDICPDDAVFNEGINPPSRKLFKLLVSLRYEYLAELDDWCSQKNFIPQIMQNRYYLRPLSREQALAVITEQPLQENSSEYCTMLNSIKNNILDFIDTEKRDEIEPVILSVLCYNLYNIASKNGKEELAAKDLQDISLRHIIRDFYDTEVKHFISSKRQLEFFEQKLVNADGRRERIKTEQLQPIGFDKNYRKHLEETHLIRITQISKEDYVELVHDTVADAIKEKRLEVSKKKRILWSRIGLLFGFICIFCFTYWNQLWTYDRKKAEHFSYMEYRDKALVDTAHGYYRCENNPFLEKIIINNDLEESTYYTTKVSNCPELEIIDATGFLKGSLSFDISDCERLRYLVFNDNLRTLTLNIKGCPSVRQIELPRFLKNLTIVSTSGDISFKTDKSANFNWEHGVLRNIEKDSVIYARSDASSEILALPGSNKETYIYSNNKEFTVKGHQVGVVECFDSLTQKYNISISYTEGYVDLSQHYAWYINSGTFRNFRNLVSFKFPTSYKDSSLDIFDAAFSGCKKLKSIEFDSASSVKISSNVFADCDSLRVVHFPQKTTLDYNSFFNCSSLDSVFFGNEAKLNNYAFHHCASLHYVSLPKKIIIGSSANCFTGCSGIKFDYDPSYWEEMEDGTIVYKRDRSFVLTNNVKYHTFSDDNYYSKRGVLYDKNGIFNIPLNNAPKDEIIKQNGMWVFYNSNGSELFFQMSNTTYNSGIKGLPILYTFPKNLNILHLPFSNMVDISTINVSLTDSLKSNITLFVPYGCLKYFTGRSYRDFKDIKEESLFVSIWLIFKYHLRVGLDFINGYQLWWLICVALVLFIIFLVRFVCYKKKEGGYNLDKILIWEIVYKSIIAVFLCIWFWYVTYWFLFLSVMPLCHLYDFTVSEILCTFLALIIALPSVYLVLYSDGFNLKGMIKSIKDSISVLWQIAKGNPKKAVKIVCLILLPFVLFSLYSLYSNYKAERLQKATIEVEKDIVDAANRDNMALDILHKAWKENFSIIKGEPIEDKLFSAIYSKMVTDGMIDGVDTIEKDYYSGFEVLPKGKLLLQKNRDFYIYDEDKKQSLIFKSGVSIKDDSNFKINNKGTFIALRYDKEMVIVDLLTQKKDTLNFCPNYYGLHPSKPVLAFFDADEKAICFFDFKTKKEDTDTHILFNGKVSGICYNKDGDEISISFTYDFSPANFISIYRLNDGNWSKVKGDIIGVSPSYVANKYFSVVRNDSIVTWPVNRIGENEWQKGWEIDSPYVSKSFSKDGKKALIVDNGIIRVLDLTLSGREYLNMKVGNNNVVAAHLSEDGKSIYVSYDDVLVKIPILSHDQIYDILERQYDKKKLL